MGNAKDGSAREKRKNAKVLSRIGDVILIHAKREESQN
jgi:hypothetical protein